jgi:hypothetical protein
MLYRLPESRCPIDPNRAAGVDVDYIFFLAVNAMNLSRVKAKRLNESFGNHRSYATARLKRANPVKRICPVKDDKKYSRKFSIEDSSPV